MQIYSILVEPETYIIVIVSDFSEAEKASFGFSDDKWCKERECERESVFMGIRHLRCYVEIDGCICEIGSRFACHSIIHWKARHKNLPEILSLNLQKMA